ncbi:MAG: redoxin family protein [Chthonomonas sp.]|nr:redoxin family protein [Chthonomonas sp.]
MKLPAAQLVNGNAAKVAADQPVVIIYLTAECPIANRYAPVIEKLHLKYRKQLTLIRSFPNEVSERKIIREVSREYKQTSPFVLDPKLAFARALGVKVSPEAVLLDRSRNVVYRGRIDGRNIEHGKETTNFRHDLAEAIDELLAGRPISQPEVQAKGCYLPID